MTGQNPHLLAEQERKLRWARRDNSLHPLTDMELAERRHYHWAEHWRWVYALAPIAASALLDLAFGAMLFTPVLVAGAMLFAWFAAMLLYFVAKAFVPQVDGFRMLMFGTWIAAGFLVVLLFPLAVQGGAMLWHVMPGFISAVAMAAWPLIWRRLRWSKPSEYERRLAEADTPPPGIIE